MNQTMPNVSNRLSLRAPQRESLEPLVKSIEATHGEMLQSGRDIAAMLEVLNDEQRGAQSIDDLFSSVRINVFNISKINSEVLMVETKSMQHRNEDGSWNTEVTEKAKAGVKWCENASRYLKQHDGKEWKYLLVPHDKVKDNRRLVDFIQEFVKKVAKIYGGARALRWFPLYS